ncbi:hypothetical protein CHGG_09713 [Chaetomium globosum CBS 148.51]|uniref:AMMECR1 domain-containing protein n=1 Tax=Chaetomium globosum (strain ATCC 6205 / CBS 148.51 / DSM 1962 / NBRC 6347 / NRRL 1970) TaxID=306901 RepID=Q2GQP1_CHAGB|nr:uncharacterized protein CHGG_09713 [Chaetomium globosum CBS 148.51]EAQ83309.1 hypothetical protein CHGG_09713 [Chaetomium globosum CBS 148.51]
MASTVHCLFCFEALAANLEKRELMSLVEVQKSWTEYNRSDTRFNPVRAAELPSLAVAVTLLTDFEDAADAADWELGVHGLRISFRYNGRRYGATYLPDVAVEQGWTKEETLVSLMRKAGWMGRKDRWEEVELSVVRYQGRKVGLEYAEFKQWRDWVDGTEA